MTYWVVFVSCEYTEEKSSLVSFRWASLWSNSTLSIPAPLTTTSAIPAFSLGGDTAKALRTHECAFVHVFCAFSECFLWSVHVCLNRTYCLGQRCHWAEILDQQPGHPDRRWAHLLLQPSLCSLSVEPDWAEHSPLPVKEKQRERESSSASKYIRFSVC